MRLGLVLLGVLALGGCGSDGNNNDGGGGGGGGGGGAGAPTLKSNIGLDLTHIVGFAISAGPPAARRWPDATDGGVSSDTATLYAIDDQGNLIVTSVTTFSGDGSFDGGTFDLSMVTNSASEKPTAIYDTPKYVVFGYFGLNVSVDGDGGYTNLSCGGVILRKSDGALFCLPTVNGNDLSMSRVETDGADGLFLTEVTGTPGAITRVDMSGATPSLTTIVDSGASDFHVNSDGDTLVSLGNSATKALRVVKQNGGLQNLLADTSVVQWVAPSGHDFWYLGHSSGTTPAFPVSLATRQSDGSFVVGAQGTIAQPLSSGTLNVALVTANVAYGFFGGQPSANNYLLELNGAGQGTMHTVGALSAIVDARGQGNSIFVQGTDAAGNGGIVRVDLPGFTQTTILTPGDFTLSAIALSKTGELTFAGLRNSDGAHVVGNVAAGASTYTILSASAPVVTTLQRIN